MFGGQGVWSFGFSGRGVQGLRFYASAFLEREGEGKSERGRGEERGRDGVWWKGCVTLEASCSFFPRIGGPLQIKTAVSALGTL